MDAAVVMGGWCEGCDGVMLVPCEEVGSEEVDVELITFSKVLLISETVSVATLVSMAADGDPPLAIEGCEFVR